MGLTAIAVAFEEDGRGMLPMCRAGRTPAAVCRSDGGGTEGTAETGRGQSPTGGMAPGSCRPTQNHPANVRRSHGERDRPAGASRRPVVTAVGYRWGLHNVARHRWT